MTRYTTRNMTRETTRNVVTMRRLNTLVRVWRSNGPGSPLVGHWVESSSLRLNSDSVAAEAGGLLLCA